MGKVVITGAAGFLGSHLVDKFLDEGWDVAGIDNFIAGHPENLPDYFRISDSDLTDRDVLNDPIWEGADLVIHSAALAHEGLSVFSPALLVESNVQATVNAVTAAVRAGAKRFVFLSSMARYGNLSGVFTEDRTPEPTDPYGIAKLASEKLVENICETHGLEWTVIVPHNIIGARQKYDDPFRNVASIFANRMLLGKQPIIYGDGSQKRSFTFVTDVVEPLFRAATLPEANRQIINVGPDKESTTVLELAEIIAEILDFDLDPIFMPDRPREVKVALCSSDKARALLGYEPVTDLRAGLEEVVQNVKDRGCTEFDYYLEIEIQSEMTPKTWLNKLM